MDGIELTVGTLSDVGSSLKVGAREGLTDGTGLAVGISISVLSVGT